MAGHGYGYHFSVANLLTHCKNNKESNKTNSNNSVYRLGNLLFESERYKIKKICVKNWWFTNTSSYKKRIINQGIFWGHIVWRAWLIRGYVKKKWVEHFNPKEAPFLCRNQKMMRVIIRHGEMVVVFAGREKYRDSCAKFRGFYANFRCFYGDFSTLLDVVTLFLGVFQLIFKLFNVW